MLLLLLPHELISGHNNRFLFLLILSSVCMHEWCSWHACHACARACMYAHALICLPQSVSALSTFAFREQAGKKHHSAHEWRGCRTCQVLVHARLCIPECGSAHKRASSTLFDRLGKREPIFQDRLSPTNRAVNSVSAHNQNDLVSAITAARNIWGTGNVQPPVGGLRLTCPQCPYLSG